MKTLPILLNLILLVLIIAMILLIKAIIKNLPSAIAEFKVNIEEETKKIKEERYQNGKK